MILRPLHSSHMADLAPCLLRATAHATDRRSTPRASYRFSQSRNSDTSECHCETSPFTTITQYTEIHVENWKYSSTKHPYRCRGIRVGTSGNTCWAPRSASRRPLFKVVSINTKPARGIWRSGRPHFRAASKSRCPQTLLNRWPMLARPITASVSLPKPLI